MTQAHHVKRVALALGALALGALEDRDAPEEIEPPLVSERRPVTAQQQARAAQLKTSADIDRLSPLVHSALKRLLPRSDPDYEDIAQRAMEAVLTALEVQGSEAAKRTQWVTAVARNNAIDRLRARSRERRHFLSAGDKTVAVAPFAASDPEHLTQVKRALERLRRSLQKLSPERAIAIYLHDFLGYDFGEIANATGATVAAVRSRLTRGRRELLRGTPSERED
jgi:RNA polymerase sigma factor (sigma-70 family)